MNDFMKMFEFNRQRVINNINDLRQYLSSNESMEMDLPMLATCTFLSDNKLISVSDFENFCNIEEPIKLREALNELIADKDVKLFEEVIQSLYEAKDSIVELLTCVDKILSITGKLYPITIEGQDTPPLYSVNNAVYTDELVEGFVKVLQRIKEPSNNLLSSSVIEITCEAFVDRLAYLISDSLQMKKTETLTQLVHLYRKSKMLLDNMELPKDFKDKIAGTAARTYELQRILLRSADSEDKVESNKVYLESSTELPTLQPCSIDGDLTHLATEFIMNSPKELKLIHNFSG